MTLYRPAKSRFFHYDFQFRGVRYHGSTGCTSKRDAQRFEDARRREAATGEAAKPQITVDEAFGLYWSAKGERQASAATTKGQAARVIKALGATAAVSQVTVPSFDPFIRKRLATVSGATLNREIELCRRVWRFAASRGYDVPTLNWSAMLERETEGRTRELSADEEERLFAKLDPDLAAVVEFALLSGQRRTAIVTLLWSKVDLPGGRAEIWKKGGGWHSFPLTPRMVAIIANRPKVAAQVFTYECLRPSPPRGDRPRRLKGHRYPFSQQGWYRRWSTAKAAAEVTDFRFHDLRHTSGTRVLRATGNLKVGQRLLGHRSITSTARYQHALEDDVRAGMLAAESRNSPEPAGETVVGMTGKRRGAK